MGAIDRPGLHPSTPLGSVCHRTEPADQSPGTRTRVGHPYHCDPLDRSAWWPQHGCPCP